MKQANPNKQYKALWSTGQYSRENYLEWQPIGYRTTKCDLRQYKTAFRVPTLPIENYCIATSLGVSCDDDNMTIFEDSIHLFKNGRVKQLFQFWENRHFMMGIKVSFHALLCIGGGKCFCDSIVVSLVPCLRVNYVLSKCYILRDYTKKPVKKIYLLLLAPMFTRYDTL